MTERDQSGSAPQPTNADIIAAVKNLASAYHEFAEVFTAWRDEERRERQAAKQERRYVRERIDQLFSAFDSLRRQVDRQFDHRDKEFDQFKAETERRLAALEGGGNA